MDNFLFTPIRRGTYFVGAIVFAMVGLGIAAFVFGSGGYTAASSSQIMAFYVLQVLLGFITVWWDYKRLIDISENKQILLLLIIPLLSEMYTLIMKGAGARNSVLPHVSSGAGKPFVIIFGIFLVVHFIYRLFLIFKKGKL